MNRNVCASLSVTLMAAILPLPALVSSARALPFSAEESVYVYPDSNGFWTGRVRDDGTKLARNLAIIPNPDFRSWARFDLSPIPDNAVITGVDIRYCFYYSQYDCASFWRHLVSDPLTAPGSQLYPECGSATIVSESTPEPMTGSQTRTFNAQGRAAVQAGLAADWVAFAWHRAGPEGWRYCYGYEGGPLKPRLTVRYLPPVGASEPKAEAPIRRLEIRPNPASLVTCIRFPGFGPGQAASLRLLDVSGRTAMTMSLSPEHLASGVRLDLSGLSPGVYVAGLDVHGRTWTEKLVVRR